MVTTTAAQELARLLLSIGEAPIDDGGATALFEAITGGRLTADITVRPAHDLNDEERALLGTLLPADAHRREGLLHSSTGNPIARVTALLVTSRVPEPARSALGVAPCGHLLVSSQEAKTRTSLGHALRGLGVSREQLGAAVLSGHPDDADSEIAVLSSARLWLPSGWPLALVTEQIHTQFLEAYPVP